MLMENGRYLIKNKKNKIVEKCLFSTLILLGFLFNTGFYYDNNVRTKLEDVTVELGDVLPEEVTNYVGVISSNLKFEDSVPKDEYGHTTKLGTYNYYLVYVDEIYKFSKVTNAKAAIYVVDTITPTIKLKDKKEFDYGSTIKATDLAECIDLSGCSLSIKENIDTKQSGEQKITIVATDGADNITSEEITITVKEKPKPVITYPSYSYYNASFDAMNNRIKELNSQLTDEDKINLRNQIVAFAKQFIGNPYVAGGTSLTGGTDCSGFVMSIYANFGYALPRSATSYIYVGQKVNETELLPGDVVTYYYGHVGIYAGNGLMVHAGTSQTGIVLAPIFGGAKTYQRIVF